MALILGQDDALDQRELRIEPGLGVIVDGKDDVELALGLAGNDGHAFDRG